MLITKLELSLSHTRGYQQVIAPENPWCNRRQLSPLMITFLVVREDNSQCAIRQKQHVEHSVFVILLSIRAFSRLLPHTPTHADVRISTGE